MGYLIFAASSLSIKKSLTHAYRLCHLYTADADRSALTGEGSTCLVQHDASIAINAKVVMGEQDGSRSNNRLRLLSRLLLV